MNQFILFLIKFLNNNDLIKLFIKFNTIFILLIHGKEVDLYLIHS